jgi:GTP-binding protein
MFFDEARIYVQGGRGGDGAVAFRREKYVPHGGPSGGSGGDGGSVYLEVDPHLNTLINFKRRSHFRAARGQHGRGKDQTGAGGGDLIIPVPPGTVAYDDAGDRLLADLTEPGQRALVAQGGRGGRGNASFATASNQAPRIAERGEPGEERWLRLELKLIADVGLVGMPNAGKSTLLAALSAARPKIAAYPFTTLSPNLGVATVDDRDFVLADIPGLIEGAHNGAGLGHQFLRHVERTRLLVHLLDGAEEDILGNFATVQRELELFSQRLAHKPQVVVLNKMDLPAAAEKWPQVQQAMQQGGLEALAISAITGQGVKELLRRLATLLAELPPPEPALEEVPVFRLEDEEAPFTIEKEGDTWLVRGRRVERLVAMTRWEHEESAQRAQGIFSALGLTAALEEAGVRDGDTVRIGGLEMVWGYQEMGE